MCPHLQASVPPTKSLWRLQVPRCVASCPVATFERAGGERHSRIGSAPRPPRVVYVYLLSQTAKPFPDRATEQVTLVSWLQQTLCLLPQLVL